MGLNMDKQKSKSMIVRNISEKLKREFKTKCASEGISQQDKIIELMREYVEKK